MPSASQPVRAGRMFRLLSVALLFATPSFAKAQAVPDYAGTSTAQRVGCKPPSPAQDNFDHCGWGVWSFETQKSVLITQLADAASYLICREQVDAAEPNGYRVGVEVDGVVQTAGTPATPVSVDPYNCFLASGRKIVLNGLSGAKPLKPVRGYYIRLGTPSPFANTISWQLKMRSATDRQLLGQVTTKRLFRVCFGHYNPPLNPSAYLKDHKLVVDGAYVAFRGAEQAIFTYSSCADVSGNSVVVEPKWVSTEPSTAFGRLTF